MICVYILLCWLVIALFLRKRAIHYWDECADVAIVLLCVLCLALSMTQPSRLLPPGSTEKVRHPPTQRRAGTGQGSGPLLMKEHMIERRESRGHAQRSAVGPSPVPPCSRLYWLLWSPWQPMSGGLDFLTKLPKATGSHGKSQLVRSSQTHTANVVAKSN